MARQLRRDEYTVGWVCALPVEMAAAREMLDEEHQDLDREPADNDENLYALGSIGGHNVAIVCLPPGRIGNNPAAAVGTQIQANFKAIRFGLIVGIGGGVPSAEADIRLGDVVVSIPHGTFGGVVQYDVEKLMPSGFERTGCLNSPPQVLLSAVAKVSANELLWRSKLSKYTSRLDHIAKFQRINAGPDVLFEAAYDHVGGQTCYQCAVDRQVVRQPRESEEKVVVHYGTIASGNQVVKSAAERDRVSKELGGVLCFEMEAAGLMNSFPCLMIRGVCDYADSHKNKQWQAFAAATAAAYAKELLSVIPLDDVIEKKAMRDAIDGSDDSIHLEQRDLNAAIADLARGEDERLDWQESVVDLLKVLNLRYDKRFREWLAESLHIRAGPSRSEKQYDALHKAILEKLAPGEAEWRYIMEFRCKEGRCLNCGCLRHREYHCVDDCGLYPNHKASECGNPVRCIGCKHLGHVTKDRSCTDSRKNKRWLPYAMATTAAWAKGILSAIPLAEGAKTHTVDKTVQEASAKATYCIPLAKNQHFVGRQNEIHMLQQKLMVDQDCHQLFIVGSGGTGKTQVALQFAYSVKERWPEYSVLWVPALSMKSFEQACVGIAEALGVLKAANEEEDVKELVQQYLSSSRAGRWLLVVDNADVTDVVLGTEQSKGIVDYLPESDTGVVVYTTRTPKIAERTRGGVIELGAMNRQDAAAFLEKLLTREGLFHDDATTTELLDELKCLPLAITQAAAYLNRNRMSFQEYLWLLRNTDQNFVTLIKEFRDDTQYKQSANAIATTWLVSFSQIRERDGAAANLLAFMSFIEWKAVPRSLLPRMQSERQTEEAIGTLFEYSFLARRGGRRNDGENEEEEEWYDIHRPVYIVTRIWVRTHGGSARVLEEATRHVASVFPSNDWSNRAVWRAYLPHALRLLESGQKCSAKERSKLCLLVGRCLQVDGRIREAVRWLEESCRRREALEEDDPDRLLSQHALATAYEAYGQVQKAVELLEHVVAVQEKVLAEEHPRRLASQYALAQAYEADGQVQRAVELLKNVVPISFPGKDLSILTAVGETALHAGDEAYHSTQVESTIGSTTLVDTQGEVATELNYSSSSQVVKQEVFTDEDCISVESNDEDIASQAGIRRTEPEILAVRQFGSFFAEQEELRPLHEEALVRLGIQRFQENYRRIFKLYVLKLQSEAHIALEKDTVSVLRSRTNRVNIAQRILALIQGDEESSSKPMDGLTHQVVEKIHLENWAKNAYALRDAETTRPIEEAEVQFGNECDSDVDTDEHRPNELRYLSITQATAFLRRGTPFQELVHELRLLVLPASIREVIACSPKHAIHISSVDDTSLINNIKAFAEDHSAFEWDWCPLMPRVPNLPPGKLRLQWTFCGQHLFKIISPEEAGSLQRTLPFIGDHPPDCSCCGTMTAPINWMTIFHRMYQSVTRICNREPLSIASTTQESSSKAQQLYTPASGMATIESPAYAHSPTQKMPSMSSTRTSSATGTQTHDSCSSAGSLQQMDPSWIVFGVQNTLDFDEIENIEMTSLLNDPSFFQELKKRHNKHRWLFRRWFSPFRFRYCRFVRFETINVDQVYSSGEALPEEHGYANHYQYDPRPPGVSNPLIDRKLFAICLKACDMPCSWAPLPSWLHKCRPLSHNSHKWKRIPRKESAFDVDQSQPGEVAFGLEADYSLSFAILFVYHAGLLFSAFCFWVYWLMNHPNDIQNASIPTFTVLGLVGALWVFFGWRRTTS